MSRPEREVASRFLEESLRGENSGTGQSDGSHAFAFYHGTDGEDYAMPMEKVGDSWKVDALVPLEAP